MPSNPASLSIWDLLNTYSPLITAVAACLGLLALVFLYQQIRDGKQWNRLNFTFTFFPNPFELEALENDLDSLIEFWKRDDSLSEVEVKALIGKTLLTTEECKILRRYFDSSATEEAIRTSMIKGGRKLKLYLNQIETYCAAIKTGVIDSHSAKLVYAFKFKRCFDKAKPYIDKIRQMRSDPTLYIEMEEVITEWNPKESATKKF